jgi:amino acid adenylation domain-containing protein
MIPLSYTQERFWFLDQYHSDPELYSTRRAYFLEGSLNRQALNKSFNEIANRHEILRTTFPMVNGKPQQKIAPTIILDIPLVPLLLIPAEQQEAEVQRRMKEIAQPFDLAQGPLIRVIILQLQAEEHLLLYALHHIITDAWSGEIFNKELTTLYQAFSAGQPSPLPLLPLQYADYSLWQREQMEGPLGQEELGYWKDQLAEAPQSLSLPTDYPRGPLQTFRGAEVNYQLSPELTQTLRRFKTQERVSLFMVLLAGLQLLLHRLTGLTDIAVGAPVAGRNRVEHEHLIGCFLNTLALRTQVVGDLTFSQLLEQVQQTVFAALQHQNLPFEKIVAELQPMRDLSRPPFFQVLLNMHNFSDKELNLSGLTTSPQSFPGPKSFFDLTLYFQEYTDSICLTLAYNIDLFNELRIHELLEQFHGLLIQLMAHPHRRLDTYSLLTDSSRAILPDPQVGLEAPQQDSALTCFCRWAARTPDQVAISHGAEILRYGDLLSRSEACAKGILKEGVRPGAVVAIRGPRSIGLIVAVLGVWRAGGLILLLDPLLPRARQNVMQHTSDATFLIEIGAAEEYEPEHDEPPMPCLFVDLSTGIVDSSEGKEVEPESTLPPVPVEGPAYVFFTSGTTGVPKGVLGSHQALAHFLAWERETLAIGPEDRVAQFTGLSFDAILRDLFLPLTSGATVCLPPEEAGGHEQLAWAATEQITVMHLVPSVASFWLAAIREPIMLPSLRWVLFAGEPLTAQLLSQWETSCPGPAQFVNLYGATETTLVKCWYLIPPVREDGVQPIGRPMPQTQLLVMGEEHRLCGLGEVGELVIRTPYCSLGYLHADDDIARRFVPNPYRHDPTDWLYYTGDLGRYRLDGTVEILGRRDDQVKIRGVRIEPQEVTAVLGTCPDVQTCTVLAGPDAQGEMGLTAYVVAKPACPVTMASIRHYLSKRVPIFLVPSRVVILEQLPLTPNGKIDRQALRSLSPTEDPEKEYVAPRTPLEQTVAAIWQEVLGLEQVGIHDNFFELGGHSLLATQVVARLRNIFEIHVPLRTFFEHPTIAQLAQELDKQVEKVFSDYPRDVS